jgi:hypothetical protein
VFVPAHRDAVVGSGRGRRLCARDLRARPGNIPTSPTTNDRRTHRRIVDSSPLFAFWANARYQYLDPLDGT